MKNKLSLNSFVDNLLNFFVSMIFLANDFFLNSTFECSPIVIKWLLRNRILALLTKIKSGLRSLIAQLIETHQQLSLSDERDKGTLLISHKHIMEHTHTIPLLKIIFI